MPNLREKLIAPIEPCLGHALQGVEYGCLEGEIKGTDLDDPYLYIGGEVRLRFNKVTNIIIGWDENAGWKCHFSLIVTEASLFSPGTLRAWPAECLHPWSLAIGKPLLNARVYGFDETPHVLRLSFAAGTSIFVGVGARKQFGDGDDVLIRSLENMIDLSDWDVLRSGSAA